MVKIRIRNNREQRKTILVLVRKYSQTGDKANRKTVKSDIFAFWILQLIRIKKKNSIGAVVVHPNPRPCLSLSESNKTFDRIPKAAIKGTKRRTKP